MIYFVRHGESEANVRGIFAGQRNDSILTEKGRKQAENTAEEIIKEGINIDQIISSPLKRSTETAQIIADRLGLEVATDKRITEYDMGTLSGTSWQAISSKTLINAEGAEDIKLFAKRVFSCIKELSKQPENILVVSHGGVIRVLETARKDVDIEKDLFYDLPLASNGSITKIDWIK